jgi:hypothetical protein
MGRYLWFVIIITAFSGCHFRNADRSCHNEQTVLSRFKNGKVRSMVIVNCLDTSEKTTIAFYSTGDTEEIANSKNGKLNGILKEFNNKGKLQQIIFENDNKIDSIWQSFDKKGRKRSVQYYTDYPSQFYDTRFDSNGVIDRYGYLKNKKVGMYVYYSPSGEIDSSGGSYFQGSMQNKAVYKVGDSLIFHFFVATPPSDSIRFSAAVHNNDDKDTLQMYQLPIVNSRATLVSRINKMGNYTVRFEIIAQRKKGLSKPMREHGTSRFMVKE